MLGKKRGLLLLFTILFISTASAQKNVVDSLENILRKHSKVDTVRVNLLNKVAYLTYRDESKKAMDYALLSGKLSDRLGYSKGKATGLWIMGLSYLGRDKKESYSYFLQALKISEKNNDREGVANYLVAVGNVVRDLGDAQQGDECYNRALKVATEIDNKPIEFKCLINIARSKTSKGLFADAISEINRACTIATKLNDKVNLSVCYNNLGSIYSLQSNFPVALDFYLMSMKINEELGNKSGVIGNLINIAGVKSDQKDYTGALKSAMKALKTSEEIGDTLKQAICLTNIGNIYLSMDDPKALEYLTKALKITKENNIIQRISTLTSIGYIHYKNESYADALKSYDEALALASRIGNKRALGAIWQKMGSVFFMQRQFDKALSYAGKGLTIGNELGLVELQKDVHALLSDIYAATNDYKKAYLHYKEYKVLNDSIFNESNVKKIADLESAYKYDKEKKVHELEKQKKNAEIKAQRSIILSLSVAFFLMLLLAATAYWSYKQKKKTNAILVLQKKEIEELNEEYVALNDMLQKSNDALYVAKKKVEESEDRLKLLIKNSNDILILENEKHEQIFISEVVGRITGYTSDELRKLNDAIHPDDIQLIEEHWKTVLQNRATAHTVQYRHKHRTKGYVWFESVAQNFLDNPTINAIVSNVRDIDERKRAEEAFVESEAIKKKLLKMEIEKINGELEMNQKATAAATLKLFQNSERDSRTIDILENIEKEIGEEAKDSIKLLIADYKFQSYSTNWQEFEVLFEKVHSSFHKKLNEEFPLLTPNERKLCAFLKFNMSNKQIAQITFQTEDALKKARLRLRKKLDIDRDTNLVLFIQNL